MKSSNVIPLVLLLAGIGCSQIQVLTDQAERTDFSQYTTFKLMPPKTLGQDKVYFNQLNQNRVKNKVREEMEVRDYVLSDDADLSVYTYLKTETKTEVVEHFYPPYSYWYWYDGNVDVRLFREGTLIMDLVETKKEKLVWHGVGVCTLDRDYSNMDNRIREVVTAIFKEYPYIAGSNKSLYNDPMINEK